VAAGIHHRTLGRLRREIEPVPAAVLLRFLTRWQHVAPGALLHGVAGLREVLAQLEGYEAPAASWERDLLPARVRGYDPAWLDGLTLGGEVVWGRLSPPGARAPAGARRGPTACRGPGAAAVRSASCRRESGPASPASKRRLSYQTRHLSFVAGLIPEAHTQGGASRSDGHQ
jgi:ATP-dependent Lhr-like helicase